jgi:hypothetical protein
VSIKEEDPIVDDTTPIVVERSQEQARKNQAAVELLRRWCEEDAEYDEQVWPLVKKLLEENHAGPRKLFRD